MQPRPWAPQKPRNSCLWAVQWPLRIFETLTSRVTFCQLWDGLEASFGVYSQRS